MRYLFVVMLDLIAPLQECAGYPGCLTKLRNSSDSFSYDAYRTVCYKWQIRLSRTINQALGETGSYSVVRNTFLVLNKVGVIRLRTD